MSGVPDGRVDRPRVRTDPMETAPSGWPMEPSPSIDGEKGS